MDGCLVPVRSVDVGPVTSVRWEWWSRPVPTSQRTAKSALDRAAAALALLLTGAFMLLVALALWAVDDGPLLTRDRRTGPDGREFDLLRFRTSRWSTAAAPVRDHAVGRLLERHHLDRLPVLMNLLRGDLSLVGPRPRCISEPRARVRPGVRPGIVQPWPAGDAPRSAEEEDAALQHYQENWSLAGDLALLWRALRQSGRPSAG